MAMRIGGRRTDRFKLLVTAAAIAIGLTASATTPAEARHRHHGYHRYTHHVRHATPRHFRYYRHVGHRGRQAASVASRAGYLSPSYASIVVDANTGRTLAAEHENTPHHPASITKVMTLYLLFEQLEKGRLALDSDLTISAHAAAQQPTKLGLRPGSSIEVEDAIKAVVTKSANDIAVAIAESIGGDEDSFAEMMTRRAHSLGMNGTTYRNASGLPNPEQVTTARDLAILGRAIQDRFPKYYRYFSTRSFYFAGRAHANHNHLLGRVEGMDGIKTGYTAASGFNLLTSVRRDGRHIVGVVLGGRSGGQRDRIMAGLIEDNLSDASTHRTAIAVAERDEDAARQSARVMESAPDEPKESPRKIARVDAPAPVAAPVVRPEPRKIETAALDLAVPAMPVKFDNRAEKARPAFVTATRPDPDSTEPSGRAARRAALEGSTGRQLAYAAPVSATPSSLRWVEGPKSRINVGASDLAKPSSNRTELAKSEPKVEAKASDPKVMAEKVPLVRPGHTGWMIQIGATEDADKAHDLLARAKTKAGLETARPFTEKVQKGSETLWRARFAGLEEDSAEAACRTLKRSGFNCFATRN